MSDDGGTPLEGVDYAFPPRPSPAALVALGKKFVVRYGGPGTQDKWIHADEAQALAAAGLWIVANAEGSAAGLARGFAAGVDWARSADAWFRGIGMPQGRPIYFSVDFDTTSDDWALLEAAMDGAASVIGRERVGVYGEYTIVAHLHGTGRAAWAWQSYAWSTGRWYGRNHIEQYLNGVDIDGADCDLNRARQADYGQWMPNRLPEGADMDYNQSQKLDAVFNLYETIQLDTDAIADGTGALKTFPVPITAALQKLAAAVADLQDRPPVQSAPVDPEALKAVLMDPQVLAAIAKAVLDEDHKRSAD